MKFLKISAKLCLMLLASLFAGIFLLWCVFLLPDRLTQTHAARSAETFSYEGRLVIHMRISWITGRMRL